MVPFSVESVRRIRGFGFFSIVMAIWLLGCVAFQNYVSTPLGTQCPTAPVQTVQVTVKDCCGKVLRVLDEAPKPGSQFFVQCRCAEKKSAQHEASLPPKLEPFPASFFHFEAPVAVPEVAVIPAQSSDFRTFESAPTERPPVLS